MKTIFSLLTFILVLGTTIMAQAKQIELNFVVDATPSDVYNAWTTREGIKTFFARDGKVELKLFGDYHIYFFPKSEPGSRGAEDEKVISFEENNMISFTWGFPPSLPDLRANQKTVVNIKFSPIDDGKTKVHFVQSGWGEGEDWQKGYDYFLEAWGKVVLPRLIYRFEVAPINWNNLPDLSKYYLTENKK